MKKIYLSVIILVLFVTAACSCRNTMLEKQEMKAPEVSLSDTLSSKMNHFELKSGNHQFQYTEDGDLKGVTADGIHPLDLNMEKEKKLNLPSYNGIDAVPYLLSCKVEPDRLIVKEWDIIQAGSPEAAPAPEAAEEYEESFLIHLKPGRIYEFTLEWGEKNLKKNGFYGKASYAVITE